MSDASVFIPGETEDGARNRELALQALGRLGNVDASTLMYVGPGAEVVSDRTYDGIKYQAHVVPRA